MSGKADDMARTVDPRRSGGWPFGPGDIRLRKPFSIWAQIAGFVAIGLLASLLSNTMAVYIGLLPKPKEKPPIEKELSKTFTALQENSQQAIGLLTRLQTEVTERTKTVQEVERKLSELEQQRKLLELTAEQRKALQELVRRPPAAKEIFTSLDFWLGRVFVSLTVGTMFFVLGIVYQRKRATASSVVGSQGQGQT